MIERQAGREREEYIGREEAKDGWKTKRGTERQTEREREKERETNREIETER